MKLLFIFLIFFSVAIGNAWEDNSNETMSKDLNFPTNSCLYQEETIDIELFLNKFNGLLGYSVISSSRGEE